MPFKVVMFVHDFHSADERRQIAPEDLAHALTCGEFDDIQDIEVEVAFVMEVTDTQVKEEMDALQKSR
jgi:hypothetical protein